MTERRFAACFSDLAAADPAPTELDAWLDSPESARKKKTPVLATPDPDGGGRVRIGAELAALVEQRQRVWRTLQELSGLVTPFTARVEQAITERLGAEHEAALAAQRQEAEQRMRELRDTMEAEIAERIRAQLLRLAGYGSGRASVETEPVD
jgi:hypothetical protein